MYISTKDPDGGLAMIRSVTHDFEVAAPVESVFPLFDAQHEAEWAPEWRYTPLEPRPFRTTRNAVFEVDNNAAVHGEDLRHPELWVVLEFDTVAHRAEYLAVHGRDFLRRVTVSCAPRGDGTRVSVRYDLTALTAAGQATLAHFEESYLATWEQPVREAARRRLSAAGVN
jgi:hypothetical protein